MSVALTIVAIVVAIGAIIVGAWAAIESQRAYGRDERRFNAYADAVTELRAALRVYQHLSISP